MFASSSLIKLFLFAEFVLCASSAKLPSYVTPCKRDPNTVSECITKEARKVLPQLLHGEKSLKIPNFLPFKFPEVNIDAGGNLKIKLIDNIIEGFEDHEVRSVTMDFDKKHVHLTIYFPRLNLQAEYMIDGRILVLPIQGKGPANITFVGGVYDYDADFDYFQKDGKDYIKLYNPKVEYVTKRSHFYLGNLFDGDRVLGEQMNKFLDENWQDVSKDLGTPIAEVISAVATSLVNKFFTAVPFDELLPV